MQLDTALPPGPWSPLLPGATLGWSAGLEVPYCILPQLPPHGTGGTRAPAPPPSSRHYSEAMHRGRCRIRHGAASRCKHPHAGGPGPRSDQGRVIQRWVRAEPSQMGGPRPSPVGSGALASFLPEGCRLQDLGRQRACQPAEGSHRRGCVYKAT